MRRRTHIRDWDLLSDDLQLALSSAALQQAVAKAGIKTIFTSKRFVAKLRAKGLDPAAAFENIHVCNLEDIRQEITKAARLRAYAETQEALPAASPSPVGATGELSPSLPAQSGT